MIFEALHDAAKRGELLLVAGGLCHFHLLGGSPHKQMELWRYFSNIAEMVSADGNMINKMATQRCQFWVPGTARGAKDRWWPTLKEMGAERQHDAPYEAFRRSCANIMAAWQALVGEPLAVAPEEMEK